MSNLRADVIGSEETLVSIAERDKLSIARECIELRRLKDGRPPGTKLVVDLDSDNNLTVEAARQYLHQYVRFLPVPILLSGTLISQQSIHERFAERSRGTVALPPVSTEAGVYKAVVEPLVDSSGKVFVRVHSVWLGERRGAWRVGVGTGRWATHGAAELLRVGSDAGKRLLPVRGCRQPCVPATHSRAGGVESCEHRARPPPHRDDRGGCLRHSR